MPFHSTTIFTLAYLIPLSLAHLPQQQKKHHLNVLSSITKALLTHTLASFWRKQFCLLLACNCYTVTRRLSSGGISGSDRRWVGYGLAGKREQSVSNHCITLPNFIFHTIGSWSLSDRNTYGWLTTGELRDDCSCYRCGWLSSYWWAHCVNRLFS